MVLKGTAALLWIPSAGHRRLSTGIRGRARLRESGAGAMARGRHRSHAGPPPAVGKGGGRVGAYLYSSANLTSQRVVVKALMWYGCRGARISFLKNSLCS